MSRSYADVVQNKSSWFVIQRVGRFQHTMDDWFRMDCCDDPGINCEKRNLWDQRGWNSKSRMLIWLPQYSFDEAPVIPETEFDKLRNGLSPIVKSGKQSARFSLGTSDQEFDYLWHTDIHVYKTENSTFIIKSVCPALEELGITYLCRFDSFLDLQSYIRELLRTTEKTES